MGNRLRPTWFDSLLAVVGAASEFFMKATLYRRLLRSAKWVIATIGIFLMVDRVISANRIPKVQDLCTVLRDADRHDGKIVVVRGVLKTHWEWGGIFGEKCKQVTIDGTKWAAKVVMRDVSSYPSLPEGSYALLDRESIKALVQEFEAAFKSKNDIECKVEVVGVLRSRDEKLFYTDKNGRRRRMGFGHLNDI